MIESNFVSYWFKLKDENETVVWEGMVLAREAEGQPGNKQIEVHSLPDDARAVYAKHNGLSAEWEPVWEDVTDDNVEQLTNVTKDNEKEN